MATSTILQELGFERAVSVKSKTPTDSQATTIDLVKEFGIDEIYFCDDENNSYPAVFLKQVVSFDASTLEKIAEVQRKIWNYKKVLFLYVHNETEIRIYNCAEKPFAIKQEETNYEKELQNLEINRATLSDKKSFNDLDKVFSSIAIDTGIIWTLEEAAAIRNKINLQRRVDKFLVDSLLNTAKKLQNQGLGIDLIHKIIMRSLFLLYLEDRGATDDKFYSQFKPNATSYFDILEDIKATYALYKKLAERFNGSLFTINSDEHQLNNSQLQLIKKCFISGNDEPNLFPDWRLFNFKIIQIELLSEIYENFLAELEPKKKHITGTYYTPPSLVELILNEKLPVNDKEKDYSIKILDPACGSGIFLIESFKRLVKRHENKFNKKLSDFNELKTLLTDNIFGIELQPLAIKVAAFSLYLALVDNLNPKTIWQEENNKLPFLINNPNDDSLAKQGSNLFCRDTIEENKEIEDINFDLVVGNPPFGTKKLLPTVRNYCNKYGFAKEMVLPFIHKAIKFSPKGEIALIFNTKVLTNTGSTYQKFREWLFIKTYVEKVYNFSILRKAPKSFGGQLFGSAVGPISIVFYKKETPRNASDRIVYYAPKTYIKSNVLEGVSIDSTDIKFLPREECKKPDTKIWKVAMWGGMSDINLISRLSSKFKSLDNYFKDNNIDYGVGFEISKPQDKLDVEIKELPIHTPENIEKYITQKPNLRISNTLFRRLGKKEVYIHKHIILNEGVKVDRKKTLSIISSFVEYKSAFKKGIVGIYSKKDDSNILKLLTLFLNSDFVKYYSFLTTSSWGIERDVVKHKELFQIPYLLSEISDINKSSLMKKFEEIEINLAKFYPLDMIEKEINEIVLDELSSADKLIISDALSNIELFHKKEKSKALLPVLNIESYTNLFCNELNDFLDGQDLFANATVFDINRFSPLMAIKISFNNAKGILYKSKEDINNELKKLDKQLWEEKAANIYFRKKLNYKVNDGIYYIIRPNQRRFWTETMAMEDASELILEILNED